jgi:hypothetical protein
MLGIERRVCANGLCSITEVGTTTVPTYCRAGGSGPNDFICQGVADAYVTLVQYPVAGPQ